jgi:hypothetical protein
VEGLLMYVGQLLSELCFNDSSWAPPPLPEAVQGIVELDGALKAHIQNGSKELPEWFQ